jgi:hypothetical protein
VLTGAKNRKCVIDAFDSIYTDLLCAYRDDQGLVRNSADYRIEQLHSATLKRKYEG